MKLSAEKLSQIKKFLKEDQVKEVLNNQEFDNLYKLFAQWTIYKGGVFLSDLTQLLLNANINILSGLTFIPANCFRGLDITNLNIPSNIRSIGRWAFAQSGLQRITLPQHISELPENTFYDCPQLIEVNSTPLKKIDISTFQECPELQIIHLDKDVQIEGIGPDNIDREVVFNSSSKLSPQYIPSEVVTKYPAAFMNCTAFQDIQNGVQYVGTAVTKCIDKNITELRLRPTTTKIWEETFFRCPQLRVVTIPEGVKKLEESVFRECPQLQRVQLPNSLTVIGDSAFSGCTNLQNIIFGKNLDYIAWGAFRNCTALKSIKFNSIYLNINGSAFSGCTNLQELDFRGVDSLELHLDCFENCKSLTKVLFPEEKSIYLWADAFKNCENLTIDGVSPSSIIYKYPLAFQHCSNIYEISGELVYIGDSLLRGNSPNIRQASIKIGTQEIIAEAFKNYKLLQSVELPTSLKEIGAHAFAGCKNLTNVFYLGTSQQFENISYSNAGKPFKNASIHCTDGDFKIGPKNKLIPANSVQENLNSLYDDAPPITINELFDLDYLYHATYLPYWEQIKKSGYIKPGINKNWSISDSSFIYLSRDPDDAASFAETAEDVPEEYLDQIVVLKIDPRYLDINKLDIDHNQSYSYDGDIDPDYPETWVQFEYDGEIPAKAIVKVIKYD